MPGSPPSTITFDLVRHHVRGIATVDEVHVARMVKMLVAEERLIAEGAAAVAVAAVVQGRLPLAGRPAAVVLTGANIDPEKLRQLI